MKPPPLRSSWQNLWYSETISCCETTKHRATHRPNQTVVVQKPRRISMLNAATYRCCCSALELLQCRIEWASRTCCPWRLSITIRLGLWEWQAMKNPNSNCPFVRGRRWKMAFLLLPTTTFVDRWYGDPVGLRLVGARVRQSAWKCHSEYDCRFMRVAWSFDVLCKRHVVFLYAAPPYHFTLVLKLSVCCAKPCLSYPLSFSPTTLRTLSPDFPVPAGNSVIPVPKHSGSCALREPASRGIRPRRRRLDWNSRKF